MPRENPVSSSNSTREDGGDPSMDIANVNAQYRIQFERANAAEAEAARLRECVWAAENALGQIERGAPSAYWRGLAEEALGYMRELKGAEGGVLDVKKGCSVHGRLGVGDVHGRTA